MCAKDAFKKTLCLAMLQLHRQRVGLLGQVKGHVEVCISSTDRVVCANLAVTTAESRSNYLKSRFCQAKSVLSEAKVRWCGRGTTTCHHYSEKEC